LITNHKWTCEKCWKAGKSNWKTFLLVDNRIAIDRSQLRDCETQISIHIAKSGHEVIHKEEIISGKIQRI